MSAEANLFGLFHTRHKPQEAAVVATYPAPVAYMAPGCNSCSARPVEVAMPACNACAPVAPPAPIQVAQTVMENRVTQVPVTRYVTQTQNVPVVENQVSYYFEPVTTMRVSTYYEPCSCGYVNRATPETSMVRKERVTPVTRYVQQHYQVPVTEMVSQCTQVPVTRMMTYVPAGAPAPTMYVPGGMVAAPPQVQYPVQALAQAPQQIPMPIPGGQVVPSAPAARDPSGYPPTAAPPPTPPRMVERIFQNEKIDRERLYFDKDAAAPLSATPAPAGAAAQPQAFHQPAESARVPADGMRTTYQWRYSSELQTVSLSKPIPGR